MKLYHEHEPNAFDVFERYLIFFKAKSKPYFVWVMRVQSLHLTDPRSSWNCARSEGRPLPQPSS